MYNISKFLKNLDNIFASESSSLLKPSILSWNITYSCNLRCSHCYASATLKRSDNELSQEEGLAFIESLQKYQGMVLVFSGGEPLVRSDDIFLFIEAASEFGLRPVIGTNGTLLKKYADKLKTAGLQKAGISVDSPIADVHNSFRGVKKAFERTLDGLKYCHKIGIGTQIHTTIGPNNIADLERMADLATELGCDAIHYFFMVPTGRASKLDLLSNQEHENLLNKLYDIQKEASILIKPVCAPQYLRVFSQRLDEENGTTKSAFRRHGHFTRFKRGCLAGYSYARVDPFGDVTPCPYIDVVAGSVRDMSFPEIWENSHLIKKFQDGSLITGKCSVCDYLSNCGGGCRARAYSLSNKLDGVAPMCSYNSMSEGV